MRSCRKGIFSILVFVLGFAQIEPQANPGKRSVGEDIFRNRCTVCHGLDGSGETTLGHKLGIPDLRANEKQLTDDQMIKIIMGGKGGMPAFRKKISRDGIYQVIDHLKELRKSD